MNATIVLDTNAIISLLDGNVDIANQLSTDKSVIVPSVVCGEFEAGTQGSTRREKESIAAFNGLLGLEHFTVAPITRSTAKIYARLFAELKKAGTMIPTNDIWIAASAIEHAGAVITNDQHLQCVSQIETISY